MDAERAPLGQGWPVGESPHLTPERRKFCEAGAGRQHTMVSPFAETKGSTVRAKPDSAAPQMLLAQPDSKCAGNIQIRSHRDRASHAITNHIKNPARLTPGGVFGLPLSGGGHGLVRFDQVLHDTRISQGRDITQGIVFAGGNLAQDAAHDFPGAGFRKTRRPLNDIR